MRWSGWLKAFAVALWLCAGSQPAAAQTILGNLPQTDDTNFSADLDSLRYKALGFTMGASAYELRRVRLRLRIVDGDQGFVKLYSDSGGIDPGTSLFAFNHPILGAGINTHTFTAPSSFTLQANTKYWLVVGGTTAEGWDWTGSNPNITPTGPGATLTGNRFSTNADVGWSTSSFVNSFELLSTSEDAPAVPEPGAWVLFLPALAAVAVFQRRRLSRP